MDPIDPMSEFDAITEGLDFSKEFAYDEAEGLQPEVFDESWTDQHIALRFWEIITELQQRHGTHDPCPTDDRVRELQSLRGACLAEMWRRWSPT